MILKLFFPGETQVAPVDLVAKFEKVSLTFMILAKPGGRYPIQKTVRI
jgi:hypothetical protein